MIFISSLVFKPLLKLIFPGGSSRSWSSEHLRLSYHCMDLCAEMSWDPQPWSETPLRAHMFQSSGVRPQDDQGNQLLWKAAQQDAHNLQEMRNGIHFHFLSSTKILENLLKICCVGCVPHPEEDLCLLWIPCSQDQGIQLVYQGRKICLVF